jgi:hypothetical protein
MYKKIKKNLQENIVKISSIGGRDNILGYQPASAERGGGRL